MATISVVVVFCQHKFKMNDKLQSTVPLLIQELKHTCDRNLVVTLRYYYSILMFCCLGFFDMCQISLNIFMWYYVNCWHKCRFSALIDIVVAKERFISTIRRKYFHYIQEWCWLCMFVLSQSTWCGNDWLGTWVQLLAPINVKIKINLKFSL